MSSQAITDYLTKQIFIEKNIITFRALSRHLSIHVNAAKNELATYHHNAPYQSQPCTATFMLTGILKLKERAPTQDVDMDGGPSATQEENDEEDDGEWAPRVTVTVVNEKDLEDTKDLYEELHSIFIYSLAPTSLHDASLLCTTIAQVRETDRANGQAYAVTVGRIATKGIKPGASKKRAQPAAPIAGPSKLKAPADAKPEAKQPEKAAADKGKEKEKGEEKPKQTGKLNFFSKPAESKTIKKEDSAVDLKKKMFFGKTVPKKDTAAPAAEVKAASSKPAVKAESPAPAAEKKRAEEPKAFFVKAEEKEEKIPPARGLKRKSSIGLESRERTPENPGAGSSKLAAADAGVKVKRRVVLSDDDESDSAPAKPAARKSRAAAAARMIDSDAERDAMALMDIDDDDVERVSRVPSTTGSSRGSIGGDEDDEDEGQESKAASPAAQVDEDVDMEDVDAPVKAKPKPRKPKTVIPVGRNGLKKRKVTKTRRTMGADGYTRKEDYSDWESVDGDAEPEEAPAPVKAAGKAKAKAVSVKKESDTEDAPEKAEKAKAPAKKPAPKAAKPKPTPKAAGTAKAKPQQQKLNFFGPKKT
ncbi:hypothetical protein D9619_006455 [Psilocybe cf. subviscida]|uniref:DNA polymerase delta subunit 3 n=1 Tax=Psilocybe cf. subviscida TaxID=2480587 RepID=A0A8H5EXP5_9AGAR|nr:hypothetical protein D9619_006455 [Psilocybe cf. subviscida]